MAITLEELAKEVQKLKDIEEIKVLKARYSAMCDDNHNWTLIKELFAPDAQWVGDPTQPWGGGSNREEIEKLFQFYQTQMDGVPLKGVLGHNPMAPQITVADDGVHATGKWNMFGAFRMLSKSTKTAILTPTANGLSASSPSMTPSAQLLRTAGTTKSSSGNTLYQIEI